MMMANGEKKKSATQRADPVAAGADGRAAEADGEGRATDYGGVSH